MSNSPEWNISTLRMCSKLLGLSYVRNWKMRLDLATDMGGSFSFGQPSNAPSNEISTRSNAGAAAVAFQYGAANFRKSSSLAKCQSRVARASAVGPGTVSYTHLTLPTIHSV